jgi:hypothetical protein
MSPKVLLPAAVKRLALLGSRQSVFAADTARLLSTEAGSRDLLGGTDKQVLIYDVASNSGSVSTSGAEIDETRDALGAGCGSTITGVGKGHGPRWLANLSDAGIWGGFGLGAVRGYHSSR